MTIGSFAMRSLGSVFIPLLVAAMALSEAAGGEYRKSTGKYDCPGAILLNQDHERIDLKEHLDAGKPVLLEFVFTSCQTICPIMSAGFSNFQKRLGEHADEVRLVSVSIDPQHDTPERMKDYLERYGAEPGWDFFTGERTEIESVRIAFKAMTSDKMEHLPLTFLRVPGDETWVRLEGLLGGDELMKEYLELIAR